MSSELMVQINALPLQRMEDFNSIGAMIAQSGMFGATNPAEGVMIAVMCHQEGVSYGKWMDTYHMIKGKKSKRADAILADLCRLGGHYKIIQRDNTKAAVAFEYDGNEYVSSLSWEDALNEPFVYVGPEGDVCALLATKEGKAKLRLKAKYATPRSRMQMLWARVVSDGVRTVCPEAVQGVYTPEEMEDAPAPVERNITPNAATAAASAVAATATPLPAKPVDAAPVAAAAAEEPATKKRGRPAAAAAAAAPVASAASKAVLDAEIVPPAASAPADAAPVAASEPAAAPADDAEPVLEDSGNIDSDYSRCPQIPNFSMSGTAWADIPTERLQKALAATRPEITAMHRAAISQVIASRA